MSVSTANNRVQTLRSLIRLLTETSELVIKEWEAESLPASTLPSHSMFEARRIIRGACDMCVNLVEDPHHRIQELAETIAVSQAFNTTLRAGVPDILSEAEGRDGGVPSGELSQRTGIDEMKLVRIMRSLCSVGIYEEARVLQYTNTHLSRVMVENPSGAAFFRLFGTRVYNETFERLPATLLDPETASATSATECAFQKARGSSETAWEYIEHGDDSDPAVKEIREIFPLAMMGVNQMCSPGLIADFPWESLGQATVVDVGGGVGSMCLDLAKAFPALRFVVEDLPLTIEKAKSVWSVEGVDAVEARRVQLLVHDFFTEQPVRDADVYFLRCILHDWPDDDCVRILHQLRDAMGPNSRILVADLIVHPPLGSAHLRNAPAPLPANYGGANAFKGMLDMCMLAVFNGTERTPEQLAKIAGRAGLRIEKVWECRGLVSITELRLL